MFELLAITLALCILLMLLIGAFGLTVGRVDHDQCARCAYPTQGLAGATCPECGAPLAGRGTRHAGNRIVRRPPRPIMVICRTLLLLMVAVPSWHSMTTRSPWRWEHKSATLTSKGEPAFSVRISSTGTHPKVRRVVYPGTTLRVTGPRGTSHIRIADRLTRADISTPSGERTRTPDGVTETDLRELMLASGVPTQAIDAYASELFLFLRNAAAGFSPAPRPLPGVVAPSHHAWQVSAPRPAIAAIFVGVFGALWWALCARLLRRHT